MRSSCVLPDGWEKFQHPELTLPDPHELLTTTDVASEFKIRPSTLEKWRCLKSQPLRFVKIGAAVRYRRQDVAEFLSKQTKEGIPNG